MGAVVRARPSSAPDGGVCWRVCDCSNMVFQVLQLNRIGEAVEWEGPGDPPRTFYPTTVKVELVIGETCSRWILLVLVDCAVC
jgi:hypothetical protein